MDIMRSDRLKGEERGGTVTAGTAFGGMPHAALVAAAVSLYNHKGFFIDSFIRSKAVTAGKAFTSATDAFSVYHCSRFQNFII